MAKKKKRPGWNTPVPQTCGVKYVSRKINGVPMYSICNKKKNHWGKHK